MQKKLITLELETEVGGPARMPRAPQLPVPETYFDTLWMAIEGWYNYLSFKGAQKGWGEPATFLSDLDVKVMYAGQTQQFLIPYVNGKGSHAMLITIYKRDEGQRVYEVTAYNS
jgi:hypothetical protein